MSAQHQQLSQELSALLAGDQGLMATVVENNTTSPNLSMQQQPSPVLIPDAPDLGAVGGDSAMHLRAQNGYLEKLVKALRAENAQLKHKVVTLDLCVREAAAREVHLRASITSSANSTNPDANQWNSPQQQQQPQQAFQQQQTDMQAFQQGFNQYNNEYEAATAAGAAAAAAAMNAAFPYGHTALSGYPDTPEQQAAFSQSQQQNSIQNSLAAAQQQQQQQHHNQQQQHNALAAAAAAINAGMQVNGGANDMALQTVREDLVMKLKEAGIEERTMNWFLQPEHAQHWEDMRLKCDELLRRNTPSANSTATTSDDHRVKNPNAWLTKYFNLLLAGDTTASATNTLSPGQRNQAPYGAQSAYGMLNQFAGNQQQNNVAAAMLAASKAAQGQQAYQQMIQQAAKQQQQQQQQNSFGAPPGIPQRASFPPHNNPYAHW